MNSAEPVPDNDDGAGFVTTTSRPAPAVHLSAMGDAAKVIDWNGTDVPTDGVVMSRIAGTSDGRIFCAGDDGALHGPFQPGRGAHAVGDREEDDHQ